MSSVTEMRLIGRRAELLANRRVRRLDVNDLSELNILNARLKRRAWVKPKKRKYGRPCL